ADPDSAVDDYTATIVWGDGHTTTVTSTATEFGQVVASGDGFDVLGSHAFDEDYFGVTFSVTVVDHNASAALQAIIDIYDPPHSNDAVLSVLHDNSLTINLRALATDAEGEVLGSNVET